MQIVTVYLENDRERKRRSRKKNAFVILAASVIAVVALAGKTPPPAIQPSPPATTVTVVEKIYVDRPILAYADPVGPPAPVAKKPVQPSKSTPPPKIRVRDTVQPPPPKEVVAATPPPPPKPEPQPILRRLPPDIQPRQIHFGRFGSRRKAVTISNPHAVPLTINRIEIDTQDGSSLEGFELEDEEKCIKSMRPGERCKFNVVSRTRAGGVAIHVFYDPAVVGMTQ